MDRQIPAYEMDKSSEEMYKLIKEESGWTRRFCEKQTRYALADNRNMMVKRMVTLEKAVEGLAGISEAGYTP